MVHLCCHVHVGACIGRIEGLGRDEIFLPLMGISVLHMICGMDLYLQ